MVQMMDRGWTSANEKRLDYEIREGKVRFKVRNCKREG